MLARLSILAAAAIVLGAGAASAAQCTTSATPVCARTSCSVTVPVTCSCREWKCVEKGGRGTAIGTTKATATVQKVATPSGAPISTARPIQTAPKLNFLKR